VTYAYLSYLTPIILTLLVVVLVIALRWFKYKERMALIAQGVAPKEPSLGRKNHKNILAIGLVLGLIGLALTIGLITLGIGPWLLFGLLPLFIGLSFILVSFVLAPSRPKESKQEPRAEGEQVTVEVEEDEANEDEQNADEYVTEDDEPQVI